MRTIQFLPILISVQCVCFPLGSVTAQSEIVPAAGWRLERLLPTGKQPALEAQSAQALALPSGGQALLIAGPAPHLLPLPSAPGRFAPTPVALQTAPERLPMRHALARQGDVWHVFTAHLYGPDTVQPLIADTQTPASLRPAGPARDLGPAQSTRDLAVYARDATRACVARAGYWQAPDSLLIVPWEEPERARAIALDGPGLSVSLAVADFNGNSASDLLVARDDDQATGTQHPDIYYLDLPTDPEPSAIPEARVLAGSEEASMFALSADVNEDGRSDALLFETRGAMLVYTNTGLADPFAGVAPATVPLSGIPTWAASVGDRLVVATQPADAQGFALWALDPKTIGKAGGFERIVAVAGNEWQAAVAADGAGLLVYGKNGAVQRLTRADETDGRNGNR